MGAQYQNHKNWACASLFLGYAAGMTTKDARNRALESLGVTRAAGRLKVTEKRLRNAMASDCKLPSAWYWPLVQLGSPPETRPRVSFPTDWFAWAGDKVEHTK